VSLGLEPTVSGATPTDSAVGTHLEYIYTLLLLANYGQPVNFFYRALEKESEMGTCISPTSGKRVYNVIVKISE
jgi:hypothetical protein